MVQKRLRGRKSRSSHFWRLDKPRVFQCVGYIFCVKFQRVPLKFHTRYLTDILKDAIFFIQRWFKSSELLIIFRVTYNPNLIITFPVCSTPGQYSNQFLLVVKSPLIDKPKYKSWLKLQKYLTRNWLENIVYQISAILFRPQCAM